MTQSQLPETQRQTTTISIAMLMSVAIMGIISYLSLFSLEIQSILVKKIYSIFNILAVCHILLILILRKKVYFSKRLTQGNLDTRQILKKWMVIDIILMALSEQIAIYGLILSLFGMPFDRLFHFFVTSALLILILMPNQTRTELRLQALKEDSPRTIC